MPVEFIGLWTNKGGVGKTTLTFHLASAYAVLNPTKRVVVIDMCPQANLSNTLLTCCTEPKVNGSDVVTRLKHSVAELQGPRTVAGYLHRMLAPGAIAKKPVTFSKYLVKIDEHNRGMPDNMWLFSGDGRLDDLSGLLGKAIHSPKTPFSDPFVETLGLLRFFFTECLQNENDWKGKDIIVFIDTNPAFTEYTQLALCTMDKLVVPVNADDFSLQAVEYMLNKVWNLFEAEDLFTKALQHESFSAKATERERVMLPKIATIIHNRHNVWATRPVLAFQQLHDDTARRIFQAHEVAKQQGIPVFVDKGRPDFEQFNRLYTGTMREMLSTGVVSAHTGVPLHRVLEPNIKAEIRKAFNNAVIVKKDAALNLIMDLLKVLSVIFEDYKLDAVDQTRLLEMAMVKEKASFLTKLKAQRRMTAAKEARAAAGGAAAASDDDESTESEDEYPEKDSSGGVNVVARAFRLNDNSCGPDCFTVMAAVTMAAAADSSHLLSERWRELAQQTSKHIRETTLRPADFNTPVDTKLSKLQQRVSEYLVTAFRELNITHEPGEQTNLEDLMRAMCTGPEDIRLPYRLSTQTNRVCTSCGNKAQQPEATTHCIEITGQHVLDYNLVEEESICFDVEACIRQSATLHGVPHVDNACPGCRSGPRKSVVKVLSLPTWLPVMFRRQSDRFALPGGRAVGPDITSAASITLNHPDSTSSPAQYDLQAVFILRSGHHSVYFKAPLGCKAGLAAGWYFYDDATGGRIRRAGEMGSPYPHMQNGEGPDAISCLLYSVGKTPRDSSSQGTPRRASSASECVNLCDVTTLHGAAEGLVAAARIGWLDTEEAAKILVEHTVLGLPVSTMPPNIVTLPAMYIFDKAVVGLKFQRDGHSWEKRDKRRIRRIAVGDAQMQVVTSFSSAPGLERRIYHIGNKNGCREEPITARIVQYGLLTTPGKTPTTDPRAKKRKMDSMGAELPLPST